MVQRSPGVTALDLLGIAWALLGLALAVAFGHDWAGFATLLWAVLCGPALFWCLPWVLWFAGADLRADDGGMLFGTDRPRRSAVSVSSAARSAYFVPWAAVSEARIVTGRGAAREMSKHAFPFANRRQPTVFHGYFPVRRCSHHLAFRVDPARVHLPQHRPPRRGLPMTGSRTWVLPVRDPEALRRVVAAHGLAVEDTAGAVPPDSGVPRAGGLPHE